MSIPEHPDGRALWTAILTRYWMDDEAHKLSTLADACKVSDRIAELEAGMAGQPLTVLGSARQLTIHPLIAEIRAQQAHKAALMRQLQLPDADEDDETAAAKARTDRARKAANTRWNRGHK